MEIIRKFNNGALGIKCAFCDGSGLEPETSLSDERLYPCPVCEGKGFNIFHQNFENLTDCRYCNSTGQGFDKESGYFTGQTCETCKGCGVIIINFDFSDIEEFDSKKFHSEVIRHSRDLFLNKQWFHCVFEALKAFEQYIQKISNIDSYGVNLMSSAFSSTKGTIKIADTTTETGKNEQEGFMHLAIGLFKLIRNPISHTPAQDLKIEKQESIEILSTINYLYRKLDQIEASSY